MRSNIINAHLSGRPGRARPASPFLKSSWAKCPKKQEQEGPFERTLSKQIASGTVRTAWAGPSPQSSGPHTKFQNKIKENDESKSWISSFSRDPQTRLLDNLVRVSLLSLDYFSYRQTLQTKSLPNMKSFIFLDVAHNSVEITEIYSQRTHFLQKFRESNVLPKESLY